MRDVPTIVPLRCPVEFRKSGFRAPKDFMQSALAWFFLLAIQIPSIAQQLPYGLGLQPGMAQPLMPTPGLPGQAGTLITPEGISNLLRGTAPAPGLVGVPAGGNRLSCFPGTQGLTCWDQSPPAVYARPNALGAVGGSDLQRGMSQRSTWDEPTQFQRFVERQTGRWLPIYGLQFFSDALFLRSDGLRSQGPEFANPADYVLGPGDEIQLTISGQLESSLSLLIDSQGQITLPRIGPIGITGLKLGQLEAFLSQQYAKSFSNFKITVRAGQLRSIQVYVVGHARQPGAYILSGQASALAAIQMAGGPSPTGSLRAITLMRSGKAVASLDLYRLIALGDSSVNMRLMPGDTLLIPPAGPRVALTGQTDQAGIYELLPGDDRLRGLIQTAGVSLALAEHELIVERLPPSGGPSSRASGLRVESLRLEGAALDSALQDGDILTVQRVHAAFSNAITLRGHVARPLRHAYRPGMRVKDLIPDVGALITPDYHERRNALVQYEGAVANARWVSVPPAGKPGEQQAANPSLPMGQMMGTSPWGQSPGDVRGLQDPRLLLGSSPSAGASGPNAIQSSAAALLPSDLRREAIPGTPYGIDPYRRLPGQRPPTEVRQLLDEIHWDYAVIERLNPKDLSMQLLPFHLGKLLLEADPSQNLMLEPGDVVTVFGKSDLRVPIERQQRLVRIEGEIQKPGYYLASDADDLISIIEKAGGLTTRAYVFGLRLTRESVRKEQKDNLTRLIKSLQDTQANVLAQAMSTLRTADGSVSAQAGESMQQIRLQQQRIIDRLIKLEPEGRIALGLAPQSIGLAALPKLGLEAGDMIVIPPTPSFISVQGATLSENALLWRAGQTAAEVIRNSGTPSYADVGNGFVLRADGSTASFVSNDPQTLRLMPGDTLVIPELADRRTTFWKGMDLARSWASLFSQIGISLVAIKTLFNN